MCKHLGLVINVVYCSPMQPETLLITTQQRLFDEKCLVVSKAYCSAIQSGSKASIGEKRK
jgi:hypothetical protein